MCINGVSHAMGGVIIDWASQELIPKRCRLRPYVMCNMSFTAMPGEGD